MKRQLSYEKVPDGTIPGKSKSFAELNEKDQMVLVKTRLKSYSNSVYRKTKVTYHINHYYNNKNDDDNDDNEIYHNFQ